MDRLVALGPAPPSCSCSSPCAARHRACRSPVSTPSHLSPDDLARVFERFYRTDPSRQRETGGTGLVLGIVRHLVEAQGGRVWARSGADEVSVTLTLPLAGPGSPDRPRPTGNGEIRGASDPG
ncbi:MAG: hypothetical protein H0V80_15665 [Acidobacteria bacterium]|nr:hypothetical protein [Acidobacteriota bacterium]